MGDACDTIPGFTAAPRVFLDAQVRPGATPASVPRLGHSRAAGRAHVCALCQPCTNVALPGSSPPPALACALSRQPTQWSPVHLPCTSCPSPAGPAPLGGAGGLVHTAAQAGHRCRLLRGSAILPRVPGTLPPSRPASPSATRPPMCGGHRLVPSPHLLGPASFTLVAQPLSQPMTNGLH